MPTHTIALVEEKPSLSPERIAAVCGTCAEFLPSSRSNSGICLLHEVPICAGDQGCSQHYQERPFVLPDPMDCDDEF